ncbi:zinc finger protein 704 isoform X2 [Scyliorhinus canicula]|uniref:zinc finger protein 704 isoform X2 n=1 Tax=Scyliorhinus canicula TaxID=7830 RepID=UPI0018F3C310|nr:zinc finger protein 704 isoform X2 [Scyliorhinus canicula]
MQARRSAKRSILGSRVCAPSPAGNGQLIPGVIQALKCQSQESGGRCNFYTVMLEDGTLREYPEEEIVVVVGPGFHNHGNKVQLKCREKLNCNGRDTSSVLSLHDQSHTENHQKVLEQQLPLVRKIEAMKILETKKISWIQDHEKDHMRHVAVVSDQKRKVVSSNIDVPRARKFSEEGEMDKVTAAMVLTSLSTSPLVRSPPSTVRVADQNGSWKEGANMSSSYSSSGNWSWGAPSDQSNPSTPSPPLLADSFKPFRAAIQPDDSIDEAESSNLLFDEPIPRKRKNSMKVMFKCLWKNCGKVLSTSAGIQKHIRTIHLGLSVDSDCSDGEEDFYYQEIKLNTDSVAEGLGSLSPASPSVASPPTLSSLDAGRSDVTVTRNETKPTTPLSRSAPTCLYLIHTDHAYQATTPVNIPGSKFTPTSKGFSISWQSPPVTFTGMPVSPTHSHPVGIGEQRQQPLTSLSSPPRPVVGARKARGEGKKCRKVYGMENRDMWCTACRWKKACQRFID